MPLAREHGMMKKTIYLLAGLFVWTGITATAPGEEQLFYLASQQEIHYASEYSYTAEKSDLAFISSRDVSISINADSEGWSATATHVALVSTEGCSIYHGPTCRIGVVWIFFNTCHF